MPYLDPVFHADVAGAFEQRVDDVFVHLEQSHRQRRQRRLAWFGQLAQLEVHVAVATAFEIDDHAVHPHVVGEAALERREDALTELGDRVGMRELVEHGYETTAPRVSWMPLSDATGEPLSPTSVL